MKRQLLPPAAVAVVALAVAWFVGARSLYALAAFSFGAFALTANLREFVDGALARRRAHGESPLLALARLVGANRRRYGGYIAHIGVLSLTLGVAASSTFRSEKEATLTKGQSMDLGGYTVRLNDVYGREEPQRSVLAAGVSLLRGGREIARLEPRMNFYPTSDQPVPTPAVHSRLGGDVYLNLMAFAQDGSNATIRVILEPLVPWIWIGGFIVCLGAVVSAGTGRRAAAQATARERAQAPAPGVPRGLEGVAS
jgi:cytochrome c-type biogenesis protein CcmF